MMDQVRKMEQMKQDINTMSTISNSMFNSLGDVMAYLNNLEELNIFRGRIKHIPNEISKLERLNKLRILKHKQIHLKYFHLI